MVKNVITIVILIALTLQFAFSHEVHEEKEKKAEAPVTEKADDKKKPKRSEDHEGNRGLTVKQRTTAEGRYWKLLRKIKVPQDKDDIINQPLYVEYGYLDNDYMPAQKEYYGHKDIPGGFWVYVYPHWYIWAEQKFY
ncbi:MAG: hypothetical protein OEZ36_01460 [Spirochaetota bacterium]|nr:hypothetical protein [Spirochaetota bacterium]